ncbi:hypothetical protein PQ478_12570 [Alkalihalophilus pseudofirmus]|uniref:hypothetical protein n=1 Tax=Alkalihalophilus pseudofirmus TaxID=79885 RepID=UPI00259B92DA|nr:hypothetical protein [Alkalihalophilus pseudofirmus]WEG15373.1 hypothetical protein PQ478_12570 [Alkalihalophilus pseudofirmus]
MNFEQFKHIVEKRINSDSYKRPTQSKRVSSTPAAKGKSAPKKGCCGRRKQV